MKKLLNTLFVTTEDAYLSLDGENVVVSCEKQELARFPLHTLSGIIAFTYAGASPALMGACAKRDIALSFCTPRGRFLARCVGETTGNVLLRRMQYRAADDPFQSCRIARNMIFGKLHNARWSIERTKRDHGLRVDVNKLQASIDRIKGLYPIVMEEISLDSLRGEEGAGAQAYFDVFDARMSFIIARAAAVRRSTMSTPCSHSPIPCLETTVHRRLRAWGWTLMSASCTATGQDGLLLHSI